MPFVGEVATQHGSRAGRSCRPVGEQSGLIISSTTSTGCYGFAYSDTNPSAAGREFYSNDGGTTWRAEAGRHLHGTAIVI